MPNPSRHGSLLPNSEVFISLFLLCFVAFRGVYASGTELSIANATSPIDCHHAPDRIYLVSIRWEEIGVYFTITVFVIIAGFAKLGFHKLSWLSSKVPESCLLILLGLALSTLIYFTSPDDNEQSVDPCTLRFQFPRFNSKVFFLVLLPPIILESAYSLHDRVFLDNLGTVLLFAVVGTILNTFAVGLSLYGVNIGGLVPGMEFGLTDALVFSSLISAVDPVAVLAIFQELGVNQNLYFLVFGESLLNDGVTVVLYNTMQVFSRMTNIEVTQYLMAVVSFFVVSVGGILIGIFFGVLTALATKWTISVRVVEPLALLGLAYLSYLTAELFHFSGIIGLIVCGLIQAHYGFYNISQKSYICVKYFTKMASATSDTVIFMFLGMVLVNNKHNWNTEFVLWSLLFCFVYRVIVVFALSALANVYRAKALGLEEQFIAAYGGLRGAVAFSLATTLDEKMPERNTYIFTTLIVILFTVFIQGITIKPLVNLLKIKRRNQDKKSLIEEISDTGLDHMMAGVEEVLGHHGDFYLREMIMHYNQKYFKKWFLHHSSETKLTRLFEKIALSEHYAHLYGPVAMVEEQIKPLIDYPSKETLQMQTPPLSPLQQDEMLFRASIRREISRDEGRETRLFSSRRDSRSTSGRKSIKSFFPPVAVKPSTSSTQEESVQNDKHALRKALRENRYNKLHYTYNRNLVNEEDQELENHLHRRSLNARRMSAIASPTCRNRLSVDDLENGLPGQIPESREEESETPEILARSLVLMERHKRRSLRQKEWVRSMITETPVEEIPQDPSNPTTHQCWTNGTEESKGEGSKGKNGEEELPLLDVVTPISSYRKTSD